MRKLLTIFAIFLSIILVGGFLIHHKLKQTARARLDEALKALPAGVELEWRNAEPAIISSGVTLHHATLKANGFVLSARTIEVGHPYLDDKTVVFSSLVMKEPVLTKADLHASAQAITFRNMRITPITDIHNTDSEIAWDNLLPNVNDSKLPENERFKNLLTAIFAEQDFWPSLQFRRVHVVDLHLKHIFPNENAVLSASLTTNTATTHTASNIPQANDPIPSGWDNIKAIRIDEASLEGYGVGSTVHLTFDGLDLQMNRCGVGKFHYPVPAKMTLAIDHFAGHSGANIMALGEHEEANELEGEHFRSDMPHYITESPGVVELKGLNINCKPYISTAYSDFNITASRAFIQRQMKHNENDYSHKMEIILKNITLEDSRIPEVLQNAITYPLDISLRSDTEPTLATNNKEPIWDTNLSLHIRARNSDKISFAGPLLHTGSLSEDFAKAPYTWASFAEKLSDMHWGKFNVTMSGNDMPNTIYTFLKTLTPSEADRMGVLTLSTLSDYSSTKPALGTIAEWLRHPQDKVLELDTDPEQFITNKKISSLPAPAFLPDLPIESATIH